MIFLRFNLVRSEIKNFTEIDTMVPGLWTVSCSVSKYILACYSRTLFDKYIEISIEKRL